MGWDQTCVYVCILAKRCIASVLVALCSPHETPIALPNRTRFGADKILNASREDKHLTEADIVALIERTYKKDAAAAAAAAANGSADSSAAATDDDVRRSALEFDAAAPLPEINRFEGKVRHSFLLSFLRCLFLFCGTALCQVNWRSPHSPTIDSSIPLTPTPPSRLPSPHHTLFIRHAFRCSRRGCQSQILASCGTKARRSRNAHVCCASFCVESASCVS